MQLGNTHYSGLEEERLLRVFLRQRPSGLIVSGIDQTPTARALLETAGCPVVQIMETGPDPVDMMVGFSHYEGGLAVTRHVLSAGYRRVGFVGARMDPRSQRRLAGYRAAMEEAGAYDARLVTTTPTPYSVSLGRELFRDALAKAPTLDAVFCNNDDLALGVLFECNRAAVAVPERIGIAGFNDLEMMQVAYPSVTSVRTHPLRDRPPGDRNGALRHRRPPPGRARRRRRLRADAAREHGAEGVREPRRHPFGRPRSRFTTPVGSATNYQTKRHRDAL